MVTLLSPRGIRQYVRDSLLVIIVNYVLVGEEGLEPSRDCSHKILSLARLPIPPLARSYC